MSDKDYKALYIEAMGHLVKVVGSRNNFVPEVSDLMVKLHGNIRKPQVENWNADAVAFLNKHNWGADD